LRRFFFRAEDGIRDRNVTGVQTCALPIFSTCFKAASNSCLFSGISKSVKGSCLYGTTMFIPPQNLYSMHSRLSYKLILFTLMDSSKLQTILVKIIVI